MTERRAAVAAPGQDAVDAALDVVAGGGGAVDAAVSAVLVACVSQPGLVSIMGGAFVNVWGPSHDPVVIDGNAEMPGRGREPERFGAQVFGYDTRYHGGLRIYGGHGTVATPGALAALDEAHQRWGRVPWARTVEAAVDVARGGYPLGAAAAHYLATAGDTLFSADAQTREFLTQNGDANPATGSLMRSPDLAASLEAIARDGAATAYTGDLARGVCADMDARGGLLGAADLAAYRTVTRPALRSRLGRWDVASNPAPSIGGPVLTTMLRLLAGRRDAGGHTDASDVIDIQRLVLGYRHRAIDRADDLELAGRELVDLLERLGPAGLEAVCASPETIHVSVTDSDGLTCSITTSAGYSSGVTTPGTGLMLNNALGEPELNRRGLHALPPGTRLASNMAPTTARRDDGAVLAIGSPGADRITTALFQVLGGVCLDERDLQGAVDQPRVHVSIDDDGAAHLDIEDGPAVREAAQRCGLPVVTHGALDMYFGGVGACLTLPDGTLDAAGDPRREAATGIG